MNKARLLRNFMSVPLLMITTLVLPGNAIADYATSCAGCHSTLAFSNKKGTTATKIQAAINNDTGGMGTPSLKALTPTEVAAIAKQLGAAVVCAAPIQVRNATTNTCVAAPAVVCKLPLVRNAATNTCMATLSGTVGLATSGAAKTDVYTVTCATGTSDLAVSVIDLPAVKAPLVSIQVTKGVPSTGLSTDTVDGDTKYSALVKLAKGAGIYTMKINKSASSVIGAEAYKAQFSCRNAKGVMTGTKWLIKQNQ
ncbi:MAG: hypothetical protein HOO93_02540 [Methyloglobulus sp.]|nr:hypothetical protein [Methyloglobulus sp.]